jgi:hypothetical protein
VAALAAFLASVNGSTSVEQEELSSIDLVPVLCHTHNADGVAQGVGSRLDESISALDVLLAGTWIGGD